MKKALVVGLGEVGRPIYELLKGSGRYEVYGYDVDPSKTVNSLGAIPKSIEFLHIAFPYTNSFADSVGKYVERFKPILVFIHSTVAPGTTRSIYNTTGVPTVFTPVRGKHPQIKKHLLFWNKWLAALPDDVVDYAAEHLKSIGLKVRIYRGEPESLELAKLWETVYRAVMIAAWQEIHRIARKFNANLEVIAEFIAEVHQVLKDRPVYFPGYIGGHCLIPNTKILNSVYPSKLFEFVLESNQLRAKELEDPTVKNEVEKLRDLFLNLTNKEYYTDRS
ncbi:MAG: GDP-mannose dehydrogenase [Thermoprotei archaeon]|nr:MAG: GDP-mannose dehydrogenase [Thermoprotei archaeon]